MHIDDNHLYHGAALIQIAEHKKFTSINSFRVSRRTSRSAYIVNSDIGVYLKYATKPSKAHSEYSFTFRTAHLKELSAIARGGRRAFVALVCVEAREICCVSRAQLITMIGQRRAATGRREENNTVLVHALPGERFRVYMNAPGVRNAVLGDPLLVARNSFPKLLFD
ncbi:MAG: hypothetical protein IBJ03_06415 [Gemmatimonadaceae bacterium]|nr:hypothetical protein [Gemmatimonadaceae bacterium]